jgi:tetratricopeptide (TPR) repeat protein
MHRLLSTAEKQKTEWLELLVYALIQEEKWIQAENRVHSLLSKRPNDPRLWQLLAHVRSQQKDLLGAASALELAYDLDQPEKKKWRDLASMYAAAGVPLMAVQAMQRGLEESPQPGHCWRMGRLYAQALRIDHAVQWMDKALSRKDNPEWHLEKADLLYAHEQYDRCREAAIRAAESSSGLRGRAWLLAGYAAWQAQDWIQAKEAFSRARQVEETAARAAACLQTVERILKYEQGSRLADSHSALPGMPRPAQSGASTRSEQRPQQHS